MVPRKDIYIGVAILALVILVGLFMHAYVSDRLARQHYEDIRQTLDSELKAKLGDIQADHDQRKTPVQIAGGVPTYFKGVTPKVVVIHPPAQTETSPITGQLAEGAQTLLPDAPLPEGSLVITPEQVPAFWDNVTSCAQAKASNATCQKSLAAADEALKGGRWYTRVWRGVKPIICAGGTAGIAAAVGAKPQVVAGTSTAAGALCAIF